MYVPRPECGAEPYWKGLLPTAEPEYVELFLTKNQRILCEFGEFSPEGEAHRCYAPVEITSAIKDVLASLR